MTPRPLRVLLVDDNKDYYITTRDLLSKIKGGIFNLEWQPKYDAALKAIKQNSYDVYLFDYHLKKKNGLELLREATAIGCKSPIIIMAGQEDKEVDIEAMKAGAADYLIKDKIDPYILERSIRYAIENKRSQIALQEAKDYAENIVACSLDAIIAVDMDRKITKFNRAAQQLFGYSTAEILGKPADILYADPYDGLRTYDITLKNKTFSGEMISKKKDGDSFPTYLSASPLLNTNGRTVGVISISRDITKQKHLEEKLLHDALHDSLTGLPNRALFIDRLEYALKQKNRRKHYLFAMLYLDVDRFKIVNDSLGHTIGDKLLIEISKRIRPCLRTNDTFARLGGDEFAIILDDLKNANNVKFIADRILKRFEKPFTISGNDVYTTASIGIVINDKKSYTLTEEVLRDADTVMYRAKAQGKARYAMFDMEMHLNVLKLLQLEGNLRHAIERQEFRLHYQPIVSLATGKIVAVEALIRWQQQDGLISPIDFIPIAEETGLIVPIGEWVLQQACIQNNIWHSLGFSEMHVAVNFSARQFQYHDLSKTIKKILKSTGMSIQALDVEITETSIMKDMSLSVKILKELNSMGITISMDDFGTGYSALGNLKVLPINTIKIGQAFMHDLPKNPDASSIAIAIIMMAHSLKLKVIAEAVEKKEQLDFLKLHHCDEAQGYLFSKPLPAEAITEILQKGGL